MGKLFTQFVQPKGFLGRIAGWYMSKENKQIIKWTLDFLDIQDGEHALEIGFGSGKAMKYLLERRKRLTITGIDPSEVMVFQSLRRLNKHLINSRVQLVEGYAHNLPALSQKIDKVLVINNVTFWENPVNTLERIRTQMNDGGKIALIIKPHEKGATDETSNLIGGQLSALLANAGYTDIEFFIKPTNPCDTVCALGMK
ncbi:class I SAM-dependent methyltransferase [Virgibacillus siamensis]|uniref:class I SAM-dependent methyltransferase n=1 Tax=Virgibacillus siamensis TaxID=480071 RepID=UPI000984A262|nr:class I SAM-dependent methyltransferase [Virgibacillus siamensis]